MKKQLFTFLALLISVGLSAQTMPKYNGKIYTYSKKADTIRVTVNDDKKTKLKFANRTTMPTIAEVFAAYKKAMATPPVVTPPVVVPPVVTPPTNDKVWTTVKLNSNEMNLGDISGKNIKFAAGTHNPWAISFSGSNYIVDGSYFGESDGLSLYIGKGNNIEIQNFKWKKHTYRPINIVDHVKKGLYIHDCSFKNVLNSVISNDIKENPLVFDGTETTAFLDWRVENCLFENTEAVFNLGSDLKDGILFNVFKGVKFLNNKIIGGGGDVVKQLCGEDIEISFNFVDSHNMNYDKNNPKVKNGPHNRIFGFAGQGEIHDNKVINHQGNAFVISPASVLGEYKESKVYNNIVYNSWKYSMLELQTYPYQWDFINKNKGTKKARFFDFGGVLVYNNTAGKLNVSKDWEGQLIDLYNINASLKVYNNLGFDMNRTQGEISDMVNYNGNSTPIVNPGKNNGDGGKITNSTETYYNNKYFSTWQQAVKDLTTFESLIPGVGAQIKK